MNEELDQLQLDDFHEQLTQLAKSLVEQIELAKIGEKPVALDQQSVGRLSRMDALAQQSVNKAGVTRLRHRYGQVLAAIRRLNEGFFGICLKCEEPICFNRLSVAPEVTRCLDCQENAEKNL